MLVVRLTMCKVCHKFEDNLLWWLLCMFIDFNLAAAILVWVGEWQLSFDVFLLTLLQHLVLDFSSWHSAEIREGTDLLEDGRFCSSRCQLLVMLLLFTVILVEVILVKGLSYLALHEHPSELLGRSLFSWNTFLFICWLIIWNIHPEPCLSFSTSVALC
jgi:hypothetical protein